MKTFAKITAIVLIVVGLLTMLSSLVAGTAGAIRLGEMSRLGGARMGGLMGFLLGTAVFIQGLVLTAVGQALYLLVEIANSRRTPPAEKEEA